MSLRRLEGLISAGHLLLGQLLYRGSLGVFWVVMARAASTREVGLFAVANSVAVPIYVALDAGNTQLLVREYDVEEGFPAHVRGLVRRRVATASVGLLVVALVSGLLIGSSRAAAVGLLVAAGYALDFLCQMWLSPDRAQTRMAPDFRMKAFQGALSLVGLLLLTRADGVTAFSASAVVLGAYVLSAAEPFLRWKQHAHFDSSSSSRRDASERLRAIRFGVAGIAVATYTRIDDVIVQVAKGASAVAQYTLAYKAIETARMPAWAVTRIVLARAKAEEERQLRRLFRASAIASGIAAVACALAGPPAVSYLFGERYGATAGVLRVLAISVVLSGVTGPLHALLLGRDREGVAARVAVITGIAIVGLLVVLAPLYGVQGAAWAVVSGEAVNFFLLSATKTETGRLIEVVGTRTLSLILGLLAALTLQSLTQSVPYAVLAVTVLALALTHSWGKPIGAIRSRP